MKAFVFEMFFLAGNLTPPPALTYYDTLTECRVAITAWEERIIQVHPEYKVDAVEVTITNAPGHYPLVVIGYYSALCLPSSLLPDKPWRYNSP